MRILNRAMESTTGRRKMWASMSLAAIMACVVAWPLLSFSYGIASPFVSGLVRGLVTAPVYIIALAVVFPWLNDRFLRREICEAMRVYGHEVCAKCGYPLRHIDGDDDRCPECGAARTEQRCQKCGHVLRGLPKPVDRCPECGADQTAILKHARGWWREGIFVDPDVRTENLASWPMWRRESLRRSLGTILILIGVALILVVVAALLNYSYGLFWWLPSPVMTLMVAVFIVTAVFNPMGVFAPALHWTYGRSLRRVVREHGCEVCIKCGFSLRGLAAEVRTCPECGADRRPMPAPPKADP